MQFVIVTGMSGAGKTTALKFLEDIGFFCVDNLPPSLISKFAEISMRAGSGMEKVALGIDIRGGNLLDDLLPKIKELSDEIKTQIVFLEATDERIIKRYKETRRNHPLAVKEGGGQTIESGIRRERQLLSEIRQKADFIIDTTHLLARQLKEKINDVFLDEKKFDSLIVTVMSFGYKYGVPNDSDLVFDVRFLPNPFYLQEMRELTGNDACVRDYVLGFPAASEFLEKLSDMFEFLLPHYRIEGKNRLVLSIGCTGGKHRSVTLANEICKRLKKNGHSVSLSHRNVND